MNNEPMSDERALAVLDRYVTGEETDGYSAADLRQARAHLAAKLDAAEKLAEAFRLLDSCIQPDEIGILRFNESLYCAIADEIGEAYDNYKAT